MEPPDSNFEEPESLPKTPSKILEIVIEPGNPRRTPIDELQGLGRRIAWRSSNISVRFAYHDPKKGTYGLTWAEIVYIWLPRMTDAIEAAMVLEITKEAIWWARKRSRRHSKVPRHIYIYGEDGRVLREIRVKEKSGHPEIIIPEINERAHRTRAPLREPVCGNWRYAVILTRKFLKNTAVTVIQSPKRLISAILERRRMREQHHNLKLYEEQCNAVKTQKTLKRLVVEKILLAYDTRTKLKENVTYGSDNETVLFETAFETEDGTPFKLVHIHYVGHGSRKEETRRYMEALAHFHAKIRDYERLTGRIVTAACVLVVPQEEDKRRSPQFVWSLVRLGEGWIFSYKDLGYEEGHGNKGKS